MKISFPRAAGVLAICVVLVTAACGSDESETTTAGNDAGTPSSQTDHRASDSSMNMGDDVPTRDLSADEAPSVMVSAAENPECGWDITTQFENFEFAGAGADMEYAAGEGHVHLFVDGEFLVQVNEPVYHLGGLDLTPGTHQIMVQVNGSDHRPLSVDGEIISASTDLEVTAEQAAISGVDSGCATEETTATTMHMHDHGDDG